MLGTPELSKSLSPSELEELINFLHTGPRAGKAMPISTLDGFLAAVLSAPVFLAPSTWLPRVWGTREDDDVAVFDSGEQARYFSGLVLRHYNDVSDMLRTQRPYVPLFLAVPEENRRIHVTAWSYGYTLGISLDFASWRSLLQDKNFNTLLAPLVAPSAPPELREKKINEQTLENIIPLIPAACEKIYAYCRTRERPLIPKTFAPEPSIKKNDKKKKKRVKHKRPQQ